VLQIVNSVQIGVQSYCYKEFDNATIAEQLSLMGISAIELCSRHLDVNDSNQMEETLQLYRRRNISVLSFGINRFENNESKIRPYFEFAKKVNIAVLGASVVPEAFELVERLCREYGVRLAIHNHGRKDKRYGTVDQLEEVLNKTSDWIGLCLDTGWLIDVGADPILTVKKFSGRVYGLHLKDFTYNEEGERHEAVLGQGLLKLPDFLAALESVGYNGYASIEFEGEPSNPSPKIGQCIASLKQALGNPV
jgi:sugar phosphate isomerase/epimerase